jgi:hypothetical protein
METFRARLLALYVHVRSPTYRDLERSAAIEGAKLPTSTVSSLLRGTNVPRWDTAEAFIVACRRSAEARRPRLDLPADTFDLDHWRVLYDQLIVRNTASGVGSAGEDLSARPEAITAVTQCVRQLIALQYPWGEWSDRRTELESLIAERNPGPYSTIPKPHVARTLFAIEALDEFVDSSVNNIRNRALCWMVESVADGWYMEWAEGQTPHSETRLPEVILRADVRHTAQTITALCRWQDSRDPLASLVKSIARAFLPDSGFWPNNSKGSRPRLLATVYAVEALANVTYGTFRLPISDLLDRSDEALARQALRRGVAALLADCEEGNGLVGNVTSTPNPYLTGLALFRLGGLADRHSDLLELSQAMVNGLSSAVTSYGWEDSSVAGDLRATTRVRATLRCAAGLMRASGAGVEVPGDLRALVAAAVETALLGGDSGLDSPDYACGLISLVGLYPRMDLGDVWRMSNDRPVPVDSTLRPVWTAEIEGILRHTRSMAELGMPGYQELTRVYESRLAALRAPFARP